MPFGLAQYRTDKLRTQMNVKTGHFLQGEEYAQFDAQFFNISPNEAKVKIDSVARLE